MDARITTMAAWGALFLGTLAATTALYGRYRILPALFTGPEVCRLEAGGCQVLFRTPQASLLGVPNAALGLLLYLLVGLGLFFGWANGWLLAGASCALVMSARLGWYLLSHRLECRICWVGHLANGLLWLSLLARLPQSG
jgi:uncharacterized membrane protein